MGLNRRREVINPVEIVEPEYEMVEEEIVEVKEVPKPIEKKTTTVVIPKGYATASAIFTGVHPRLIEIAVEIITNLRQQGFEAIIHNAARTKEQAAANAASGVGIKNSKHVIGMAMDIIDKRYAWEDKHIDGIKKFRKAYGELASKYSEITWGGTWTTGKYGALGDWAHIELKG